MRPNTTTGHLHNFNNYNSASFFKDVNHMNKSQS